MGVVGESFIYSERVFLKGRVVTRRKVGHKFCGSRIVSGGKFQVYGFEVWCYFCMWKLLFETSVCECWEEEECCRHLKSLVQVYLVLEAVEVSGVVGGDLSYIW